MTRKEILTELLEIEERRCDLQKSVAKVAKSEYYQMYGNEQEREHEQNKILDLIMVQDIKFNTLKEKL